jgi:hypothetical protein
VVEILQIIKKEYWKKGKLEFGYELGITGKNVKFYTVRFMYPAYLMSGKPEGNVLKLYKNLSTAEKKISAFREYW